MRRLLVVLVLLSATFAYGHGRDFTINGDDCTRSHHRFHGRSGFVSEEVIEAGNLRSLSVNTSNSPLKISGGNSGGYTITVCKAAELAEDLAKIRVSVEGGELRATGPDDGEWAVSYHVQAPNGADLRIDASNGPVSIRDIDATIVARLRNGPLSLHDASGNIDVVTANGPISIDGGSGTMKVQATNGPLSVKLENTWNGTLDASTKNGPLNVKVARDFSSGVVVESRGRGPISCRAAGCERANRYWDDDEDEPRVIELGRGPANVRLSTVNGPVTIREE
ncbi:MAG TPA: DUF4097 family beta strand repeat-containing protein [Thermoanaerobaculia bacterium]|nr:DUF4097 family beta strand repeat-containing protein [Thermoanaerobaculia bacterium]